MLSWCQGGGEEGRSNFSCVNVQGNVFWQCLGLCSVENVLGVNFSLGEMSRECSGCMSGSRYRILSLYM